MAAQEIRVPDIGDFTDVPIIEIHVSPGDTVAPEDPLLTLESDKATLDVPSPVAGTVTALTLAVGDTVSQGTVIGTFEVEGAAGEAPKEKLTSDTAATAGGGSPETAT
ncbi:MAG: dihydrolipoamide dehydrogenase, partial [Pseudonocardiales bacterium]|nr:dihydrolipoamide dehydrogenase [Pseudonocardiales bacterium]